MGIRTVLGVAALVGMAACEKGYQRDSCTDLATQVERTICYTGKAVEQSDPRFCYKIPEGCESELCQYDVVFSGKNCQLQRDPVKAELCEIVAAGVPLVAAYGCVEVPQTFKEKRNEI